MHFVQVGDVVLHAERRGDPARPLLVFANSLGTDLRIWDGVVPGLLDRYSVLLYDKRGHGLSDAPPGRSAIEDHARDCIGLIDHFGAGRFGLVGLSVGGMIALSVAADHGSRVAALVLCDTAARIGTAESWNARMASVETHGLASIAGAVFERWFTRDYRVRETAAMRGWHNMLTRQPASGYAATCAAIRDADLTGRAAAIDVPTLCVVGDQDLSTPPELVRATAGLIRGARFAMIADAGHLPCIDQPTALRSLITEHLAAAGF